MRDRKLTLIKFTHLSYRRDVSFSPMFNLKEKYKENKYRVYRCLNLRVKGKVVKIHYSPRYCK
ncbi:hypothetical protein UT300016_08870 [Clostridium senegalense]